MRNILRFVIGSRVDEVQDTSWLNGARGLAAWLVMMAHFSMSWLSPFADAPFGALVSEDRILDEVWYFPKGKRLLALYRLPIVRVFFCTGGAQVAVFFVISGFVLTWKPLGAVHSGQYEKLYQTLGSSTIRRWFRLYLPCIIVTIPYFIHGLVKDWTGVLSMFQRIWGYIVAAEKWANPFQSVLDAELSDIYRFNIVIWTIPIEFSGSIFVYVLLLGLGRIQSFARRVSMTIFIALYAFCSCNWGLWLFGSGMALADYVRYRGGFQKISESKSRLSTAFWVSAMIAGYLCMSFMPHNDYFSRPGYEWTWIIPLPPGWRRDPGEERFMWGCGGILLIASACHLTTVRRFYETRFLQHLGKVSFMLYLIHFLIDDIFAVPLKDALYALVAKKQFDEYWDVQVYRTTPLINTGLFVLLLLICATVVLVIAHTLEIYVDRPVTRFGKWFDETLLFGLRRKTSGQKTFVLKDEEEELLNEREELELGHVANGITHANGGIHPP